MDVNDELPYFLDSIYLGFVAENQTIGEEVLMVNLMAYSSSYNNYTVRTNNPQAK